MKFLFLVFTFTLMIFACGKKNSTGKNYPHCLRRDFEVTNCRRMYASSYGQPYTNTMCERYGMTVPCN